MDKFNGEEVLVIAREYIEEIINRFKFGLITSQNEILNNAINKHSFMLPREKAENDPAYKQIIPYAVIKFNDELFMLKRSKEQAEERLHNKLSLGIGGHINPVDYSDKKNNIIINGLLRELSEEVKIPHEFVTRFIGYINDDNTEVGRVHLGALFEIETQDKSIVIKENNMMVGSWETLGNLIKQVEYLETWSKIALDYYLKVEETI